MGLGFFLLNSSLVFCSCFIFILSSLYRLFLIIICYNTVNILVFSKKYVIIYCEQVGDGVKKIILFFSIMFFVFNSMLIICYADDSSFVNKAILSVKKKIDIPANYTNFNSKLTVESNAQFAYFTWYGDENESNPGGQINVTVDKNLRILSFSQYFYGEFSGNYKLSDYSSIDAENEAIRFLSRACPEIFDDVKLVAQEYSVHRNFEPYEFKFIRYVNDLPCYDNYIDVKVDAVSGKVSSVEVKWIDYDKIYPARTLLNPVDAQVDMYDNIGVVLEYAKKPDGEIYVRYRDLSDGINYINAYTGNIINTNIVSTVGSYRNALTSHKIFDFWICDEIEDISLVHYAMVNNPYIPLDASYSPSGIQYLQDNHSKYVYFECGDTKGNVKTYIIDAVYGDIRYYNYYQREVGDVNHNYSAEECKTIAEAFVNNYEVSIIDGCRLLNYNKAKSNIGEEVYYFNYTRYINGVAYDENGVVVGVSRSTGDVVSVISGWEDVNIPQYSLSLSPEEAFAKYIDATSFELQYVSSYSMTRQMELRLVYAPSPLHDYYVDAMSGNVVDKDGNSINTDKFIYTDIGSDVSKEQIMTLYACGIFDGNDKFYPYDNVVLCDYLLWMCRAVDCVDYKNIEDVSDKLIGSGIVLYEDLALNQPINMEMGIKYIVKYLGYDKVASLKDTYKTGFVDEGMISPDLIGYAAIAKGLKIFEGNAFLPKEHMKRNVAAQIIYNLISN